ncbi:MAG TPA: RNA polymerase sigma factor, partial [Longimicrobium sp.]|nr:RNA polymerase sigma factor [Longimicrobium sp.]
MTAQIPPIQRLGALRSQDVTGSNRPFEELVREHEGMLYRKALQLCGSQSDARDLVQETFERGLRSYDRYKPQGTGVSWLMTILRNLVIDRCRSRVREPRVMDSPEELEAQLAVPEPEAGPAWSTITPEQVREALGKLNEDFRVAYEL